MNNEDIAVKLAEHGKEIGLLKYRTKELEEKNNTIQELVLSVQKLAVNMQSMLKEQERQGEAITVLQERPAKRWDTIITAIITAVISGIVGFALANIF